MSSVPVSPGNCLSHVDTFCKALSTRIPIFLKTEIFSPFSKKYASTRSTSKNDKTMNNLVPSGRDAFKQRRGSMTKVTEAVGTRLIHRGDSIPDRACVILVVYDVFHYRIQNLRFRQSTGKREAGVFENLHYRDLLLKTCVCGARKRLYVWT